MCDEKLWEQLRKQDEEWLDYWKKKKKRGFLDVCRLGFNRFFKFFRFN